MLSLLALLLLAPARADGPDAEVDWLEQATPHDTRLGLLEGHALIARSQSVPGGWAYEDYRITLFWGGRKQVINVGLSSGIAVSRDADGVLFSSSGDRYSNPGWSSHLRWRFDAESHEFYPAEKWTTDPWQAEVDAMQQHLDRGEQTAAVAILRDLDLDPSGHGLSWHAALVAGMFTEAAHREAKRAWRGGRPGAAAEIALNWGEFAPTNGDGEVLVEFIEQVNDLAFFLDEGGHHERAAKVLGRVVEAAPDRTVAWLNLADAEWALDQPEKARGHYETYLGQMTKAGKEERIPARVGQRMNP